MAFASKALLRSLLLAAAPLSLVACASSSGGGSMSTVAPSPDPRVGLRAGMMDAAEASWNLRVVSKTPPPERFAGITNSDLAFTGQYAIQGNYNGFQVWDISQPAKPALVTGYLCPASQSDVSAYRNLLFVSAEGLGGRLDCGTQGVRDSVSADRIRGIRIFDISDIAHPRYIGNVQTCRGSHTHTVVADPNDRENVYVYVSGSAQVRSPNELPGCSRMAPEADPSSALFRIEVIRVPLAHPEQARIVSTPRIFAGLTEAASHGEAPEDVAAAARAAAEARAKGAFTATIEGLEFVIPARYTQPMLDSIVNARQGTGAPTAADSAALRGVLQGIVDAMVSPPPPPGTPPGARPGPSQCHDITVYPAIGLAGGACGGYGLLLDIRDVVNPRRIDAVADSNFAYWHSATFNNDGTRILFTDEWGGGGAPKCRSTDKPEWGADAIFTLAGNRMTFGSYFKMPAPQTALENCVAHNGSLIPVPGRDIMVQAWYQGGISVFDWTDAAHPREIAFFDRGPADSTEMGDAGSWSAYWYNGYIYSSEIGRGLDVVELVQSGLLSRNEIEAAKLVRLDYFNAQSQPQFVWPASFVVARAYLDQLERSNGLAPERVTTVRNELARAERLSGQQRRDALTQLVGQLAADAAAAADGAKVRTLAGVVRDLGAGQ
ncbi:MAG: LVIVD repeat-containing protein [Gemmatimonadales bacterium]